MVLHYPAISHNEFAEACQQLDVLCTSRLENSNWSDAKWTGVELQIRQKRGSMLPSIPCADKESESCDLTEEDDMESLLRQPSTTAAPFELQFSIVLSPSYQVPVLWFSPSAPTPSSGLPGWAYDSIVLPESRDGLRSIGVLGGISVAHHPVSDLPALFIHPCRTQEALQAVCPERDVTPLEYLMLWFGVICSVVGLAVPIDVMSAAHTTCGCGPQNVV